MPTKETIPARIRVRMTQGEMLRTMRELQEMSQAELSDASHVSQPAISALEAGRSALGPDRAVKLARALHVHPALLMFPDWEPEEERVPERTRRPARARAKPAIRRRARTAVRTRAV